MLVTVILAGILSYFGNHILHRGLVFIDIAVGQIAALGTMIGILIGFAENSAEAQLSSYIFTIIVLGIFSVMKVRNQLLPQEAIIGIFYCLALGMALLLAEKIPGGSNYITKTITGNVLWVTWKTIINTILILAPVVIIQFIFGRGFRQITESKGTGESEVNGHTRILEFIFYLTFGIVIVRAIPVMGVFLVFIL
ncbi:MAG: metal ABC transporter permease [Bacteroidales bacterium]